MRIDTTIYAYQSSPVDIGWEGLLDTASAIKKGLVSSAFVAMAENLLETKSKWEGGWQPGCHRIGFLPNDVSFEPYLIIKQHNNGDTFIVSTQSFWEDYEYMFFVGSCTFSEFSLGGEDKSYDTSSSDCLMIQIPCPWSEKHNSDKQLTELIIGKTDNRTTFEFKCRHMHCMDKTTEDFISKTGTSTFLL